MAKINRWLLPEGVEEILPRQAWQIEQFRRRVLDIYRSWGYELVIPPLIEYSESLLLESDSDMDLQSFKLTDQLSGRTMALRADITPQTARIDAHSWQQEGPTRLCYAGTVVHTKPKSQLASRVPIEVGAELYGDASIHSDAEIISLMLTTIHAAGIERVFLDLGHVGIYSSLVKAAGLSSAAQAALLDAFDRKAKPEVAAIVAESEDKAVAAMLLALVDLNGDISILSDAREKLANAPASVLVAIDYLQAVVAGLEKHFPNTPVHIDLAELRGYRYHTGLVFAAYINGVGHAVANGGRYDGIGAVFGRARPATGFSANVKALLAQCGQVQEGDVILAPAGDDDDLIKAILALRESGERVVQILPEAGAPANGKRQLVKEEGVWQVKAC